MNWMILLFLIQIFLMGALVLIWLHNRQLWYNNEILLCLMEEVEIKLENISELIQENIPVDRHQHNVKEAALDLISKDLTKDLTAESKKNYPEFKKKYTPLLKERAKENHEYLRVNLIPKNKICFIKSVINLKKKEFFTERQVWRNTVRTVYEKNNKGINSSIQKEYKELKNKFL